MGGEVGVGLGEVAAAEEPVEGGKRRRMGGGEDEVARGVDEGGLGLGLGAPEHEDDVLLAFGDGTDDGVGEGLPAFPRVGEGGPGADGENRIEQENPLAGPGTEIAADDGGAADVIGNLLEHIAQGGGRGDAGLHREGETVGVAGGRVGVLAEDDDAGVGKGAELQGGEDVLLGRQDVFRRVDVVLEGQEPGEFRGVDRRAEDVAPIGFHGAIIAQGEFVIIARMSRLPLALTGGDCAGIGPEITAAAAARFPDETFCLYTCRALFERACTAAGVPVPANIVWRDVGVDKGIESVVTGRNQAVCGEIAYRAVMAAGRAALAGEVRGIVTAPFSKTALRMAGHTDVPGHTELLARLCGREEATMAFLAPGLFVSLATIHVALAEVPRLLTPARLGRVLRDTAAAVRRLTGEARPEIGVLALNPHAGEEGAFGDEEARCLRPAMEAFAELARWQGPLVPDVAFRGMRTGGEGLKAFVAMYHDQGLIPFKMVAFDSGVNVTLGLPIVRTSPDHGTAFDRAWQGTASPDSMVAAIEAARRLTR